MYAQLVKLHMPDLEIDFDRLPYPIFEADFISEMLYYLKITPLFEHAVEKGYQDLCGLLLLNMRKRRMFIRGKTGVCKIYAAMLAKGFSGELKYSYLNLKVGDIRSSEEPEFMELLKKIVSENLLDDMAIFLRALGDREMHYNPVTIAEVSKHSPSEEMLEVFYANYNTEIDNTSLTIELYSNPSAAFIKHISEHINHFSIDISDIDTSEDQLLFIVSHDIKIDTIGWMEDTYDRKALYGNPSNSYRGAENALGIVLNPYIMCHLKGTKGLLDIYHDVLSHSSISILSRALLAVAEMCLSPDDFYKLTEHRSYSELVAYLLS